MRYTTLFVTFLLALTSAASADEQITQAELLHRVIDLNRLTLPPNGEHTGMFSSFDRSSRLDERGNPVDWDANDDRGQFIRQEADGWSVMAEMTGPGAITRIWTDNPTGRIRFVFDGSSSVELDFAKLFNGQMSPFGQPLCYVTPGGGHNCYFPIGYARSCQVLARDCTSAYQINHAAYRPGTQVQTFSRELDEAATTALADVTNAMQLGLSDEQIYGDARTYSLSSFEPLRQGNKLSIETFDGGGTIRSLNVSLTDPTLPKLPYVLHQCVLRIYFDNEERPSVEAPLTDFFGSGFSLRRYNSLLCGTDKWTTMPGEVTIAKPMRVTQESRFMYCYFPMPFRNNARVELESPTRKKLGLMLWARIDRTPPPPDALRFYASFRREDPCDVLDYPILAATGPGRIVGCTLNVDCPREAWWGEGDEKIWLDEHPFPAYFGTSSAGFLGDASPLRDGTKALHGVTRSGLFGKASGYRWFLHDCVNFEQSVRFTLENLQHGGVRDTYYGSVVYWYGQPGVAADHPLFEPLTAEILSPPGLRIPGAIEIEGHVVGDGWGTLLKEKYAEGDELSGHLAANITTTEPVQVTLPSDRARSAQLILRVHQRGRRFFETIEVSDASGNLIGTIRYERGSGSMYVIGTVQLAAGDNLLTVRCSKGAVLDCWMLRDPPPAGEPAEAPQP